MQGLMTAGGGLSNSKLAMANAALAEVLSGKTFYAGDKVLKAGTMPNNGAWSTSVSAGSSITIPKGYHNGAGKVSSPANFSANSGNREATGGSQEMRRDESNHLAYANTYMRINVTVQGRKVIVSGYAHFHVDNNGTGGIVGTGDYSGCWLNFEVPF